jgi:type IV secretory pathway VirB2 component (pilin)
MKGEKVNTKRKIRWAMLLALIVTALAAVPVHAAPQDQAGGGDFGLSGMLDNLLGLISDIAKPIAVLGLAGWGVAQFAQPFAPEVNSKFQGYATKLVFGAILVLGAATIADWIFGIGA